MWPSACWVILYSITCWNYRGLVCNQETVWKQEVWLRQSEEQHVLWLIHRILHITGRIGFNQFKAVGSVLMFGAARSVFLVETGRELGDKQDLKRPMKSRKCSWRLFYHHTYPDLMFCSSEYQNHPDETVKNVTHTGKNKWKTSVQLSQSAYFREKSLFLRWWDCLTLL